MKPRAVIVDDSLTVRMDLADAFEAGGFLSLPCASAAEARSVLAREAASVIVLDVVLPDGDGIELLREVRANPRLAGVPVLMLSSEAEVRDRIRGLETGADDYVGKPYDTGHVVARAKELVRQRDTERAADQLTVLVIDDSATYRDRLAGALEGSGYVVAQAASGEEGLRLAATARPAVIIVDGVMPGIDGATVIRRIRLDAALRTIPCVLLTASEDGGAELRALDSGADAFIRKEEDLETVLARIGALVRHGARVAGTASLLAPKRILAVDDSPTYLNTIGSVLREEGYDVVLARSGEEALELLGAQSVDCILLDLMMPGLGGQETCRRIKSSPMVRDIPLIMLTAVEERQAMIDGLSLGADDYISKSNELEVLKARVRAQIRRKQFEDEHRQIREDLLRSEMEAAEARSARRLAEARSALVEELERKNRDLESFSDSVSHDLRGPLRTIDAFSRALLDDHSAALDDVGRTHLSRIRAASQRMAELIDALLELSRVNRADLLRTRVDLTQIVSSVIEELRRRDPERQVTTTIQPQLIASADSRLLRSLFDNLLGNAWKFTSKTPDARIEVTCETRETGVVFSVRDNGAGFDMAYAGKLFAPFQRLHTADEFPGTGIGLATVYRIVDRHGGRLWAEGAVGRGATISFTLAAPGHYGPFGSS
jgi:DNA-binding response OmpR family regulator